MVLDFSLSDEQKLLQDSVAKFVKSSYDFDRRRKIVALKNSFDPVIWQQFADLGWLVLPFAEADYGLGGSLIDTMVMMEEFGKGLVVEPYVATIVLGGGFLRRASVEQKQKYLGNLISGKLQLALAIDEYEQTSDLRQTNLPARPEGSGYVLQGRKSCVINGNKADLLVVLARTGGIAGDEAGLSLFLVDRQTPGVTVRPHRTVDGQQAAEVNFDQVLVGADRALGGINQAHALAQTVITEGILALGAEAVGALSVLLYSTVEYTRTRKQFGVAIGSFQVLQHRMTDMFMAYEQTRSLLLAATLKVHEGHADAMQAVHALKAQIGRGGRLIAQEAIQLHGGMGMTDELAIGHYFKRITAIDALFGHADQHIRAYAGA
jgi:alkylation response protein AidB-like acyl-CoA dehydrogenase